MAPTTRSTAPKPPKVIEGDDEVTGIMNSTPKGKKSSAQGLQASAKGVRHYTKPLGPRPIAHLENSEDDEDDEEDEEDEEDEDEEEEEEEEEEVDQGRGELNDPDGTVEAENNGSNVNQEMTPSKPAIQKRVLRSLTVDKGKDREPQASAPNKRKRQSDVSTSRVDQEEDAEHTAEEAAKAKRSRGWPLGKRRKVGAASPAKSGTGKSRGRPRKSAPIEKVTLDQTNAPDQNGVEHSQSQVESEEEIGGGEGVTGILMNQTPVKPIRPLRNRNDYAPRPRNPVASQQPTNGSSSGGIACPSRPVREAGAHGEDPAEEDEPEEDDTPNFGAWGVIISEITSVFDHLKKVANRLGCYGKKDAELVKKNPDLEIKTELGKQIDKCLGALHRAYKDLREAYETSADDSIAHNNIIKQFHVMQNLLGRTRLYLADDSNDEESKKDLMKDLFFFNIRKFTRRLRQAFLSHASHENIPVEAQEEMVKLIELLNTAINITLSQPDGLIPQNMGQTKQPLRGIRSLLRQLLEIKDELARQRRAIEVEKRRARDRELARKWEERLLKEEQALKEEAAKARAERIKAAKKSYQNCSDAVRRGIEAELRKRKELEEWRRSQSEKERWGTADPDRSAASNNRGRSRSRVVDEDGSRVVDGDSSRVVDEDDSDDPFSDNYIPRPEPPPRSSGVFAQYARPRSPSPSLSIPPIPSSSPSAAPEPIPNPNEPFGFGSLAESDQKLFIATMKWKYENRASETEVFAHLKDEIAGGRYELEDIWEVAKSLQDFFDGEHLQGRARRWAWSYEVWRRDGLGGPQDGEDDDDDEEEEEEEEDEDEE